MTDILDQTRCLEIGYFYVGIELRIILVQSTVRLHRLQKKTFQRWTWHRRTTYQSIALVIMIILRTGYNTGRVMPTSSRQKGFKVHLNRHGRDLIRSNYLKIAKKGVAYGHSLKLQTKILSVYFTSNNIPELRWRSVLICQQFETGWAFDLSKTRRVRVS